MLLVDRPTCMRSSTLFGKSIPLDAVYNTKYQISIY